MIIDATQASSAWSGTYSTHLSATWQPMLPPHFFYIVALVISWIFVEWCTTLTKVLLTTCHRLPRFQESKNIKKIRRMQKTFLNPRKPKGLRPLLAALLLVLGAQPQLGQKCQLALLLPRPPPPAPPWRSFRSSCRLGSCLCNGCCPQEVTLTHWWSCGNFFASVPTNK